MAINNLGLGFVFTARNLASGTINRLRGEVSGLGGTTSRSGRVMRAGFATAAAGLAPLLAGLGTLGGAMSLANAAGEFEQGMARVGNISGASASEMRDLRDAAIQAGIATQFSPGEAVEGLQNLASVGFSAEQSISLLNQALGLAAGGQIGVADATRATASAIRVFNLQGEEQQTVADRLLKITSMTALQSEDLTLALGTVARGAGLASQNLDEMLISMGLVRNTGVETSVAASGVSSALQFVAKNADAFDDLGVNVTDAEGNFRDFLDIATETATALDSEYTDQAERAAAATELFGRFGTSAFQAVNTQLQGMVGTIPGVNSVQDAIAHLRAEMGDAAGTAAEFQDRLLDTFEGQKTLLQGTLQTLAVSFGEPLARVFKPAVTFVVESLNTVLRLFEGLPDGMKDAIAGFIVFTGVILTATGALMVFVGVAAILAPFAAAIGVIAAKAAALIGVFVAIVSIVTAVGRAFSEVFDRNIAGAADRLGGTFDGLILTFQAVKQFFTQGFLSGEVAQDLSEADENFQRFVFVLISNLDRVRTFFAGIGEGFSQALDLMAPSIDQMLTAFEEIGNALGLVDNESQRPIGTLSDFASVGARVGGFVADAFNLVVRAITTVARFFGGFIRGARRLSSFIEPVFEEIAVAAGEVITVVTDLFHEIVGGSSGSGDSVKTFGEVAGSVFGAIIAVVAQVIRVFVALVRVVAFVVGKVTEGLRMMRTGFQFLGLVVRTIMGNIISNIANTLSNVLRFISTLINAIPERFRTEGLTNIGNLAGAQATILTNVARNTGGTVVQQFQREAARGENPFAASADVGRRDNEALAQSVAATLERDREERRAEIAQIANRPIVLQTENETIARAAAAGQQSANSSNFNTDALEPVGI